ncbi:DUF1353 domain-containing protein [Roseobacter sp. HKCCA0434]|uniref:DUF1353 domain-containing protein n=1 Tax=Roseobacter sp. HKCCA0434 TaxID=3079297 RepID=UPI002905DB23|nr:DUF1353 domain-containing protein [Roseobacter sp. HKCCA0434]
MDRRDEVSGGGAPWLVRFDHPAQPANPYPERVPRGIVVKYTSALRLLRLRDAPKMRDGEDADYIVSAPFTVVWQADGIEPRELRVPAGLITDLVSVPRPFRWIVSRAGPYLEAAILHDYLYIAWQDVPGRGVRDADRAFADAIMLAAMAEARVGAMLRWVIHASVRLFGGRAYARPNPDRYADLGAPEIVAQSAFVVPDDRGPRPDARDGIARRAG